jgi:ABC-2 type transport system permease protein
MKKIMVLARREMASYFVSPMAYVIGAMFVLFCGLVFFFGRYIGAPIFEPGNEASLRRLFEVMAWAMMVAVPLLTMKLVSDEFRSGTIETLMTAPVTDSQVILGKFLGVMAFYLVLVALTGVFLVLLCAFGQPDAGIAVMGYLGMILLGAAFVSVGLFASTLTSYQIVAGVVGIAILGGATLVTQLLITSGVEPVNYIAARMSVLTYFGDFAKGVFDTRAVVFFLSVTAAFLFLSVKTLESRRWR